MPESKSTKRGRKKSKATKNKPRKKGVLAIVRDLVEENPTRLFALSDVETRCNGQKKSTFEIQVNKLCQTNPDIKKLTVGKEKFVGSATVVDDVQAKIQAVIDEFGSI
jgi:hypothetical protein